MSSTPHPRGRIRLFATVLLGALSLLLACGAQDAPSPADPAEWLEHFVDPDLEPFAGDLEGIRERRVLRALVTPNRTDFFIDHGHLRGVQVEFLRRFVERLNQGVDDEAERIRIKYVPVPFNQLLPALIEGRGDIAAAFLTVTPERSAEVDFAAPFRDSVREVVVTHVDAPAPQRVEDLSGTHVYVLNASSHAEHLRALDARLREAGLAPIDIEEADPRLGADDILELVNAGVVDATVMDDYKALLWQRVLPNLVVHESVATAEGARVAWAVRRDAPRLRARLDAFMRAAREGTLLGNIVFNRYFENTRWISDPNQRAERDKLERHLDIFREYGERYGFDPLALAAQAYQESGLDSDRRSPRGAVGLMQILPTTAEDPNVDVSDIERPERNVEAAAKYLAFIRDRYFDDPAISAWDRRALAWAAYNAGPAAILEARSRAAEMGLDPNVWFDNVEIATALVAGQEPVRYVANVYRYYVAYRMARFASEHRRRAARDLI